MFPLFAVTASLHLKSKANFNRWGVTLGDQIYHISELLACISSSSSFSPENEAQWLLGSSDSSSSSTMMFRYMRFILKCVDYDIKYNDLCLLIHSGSIMRSKYCSFVQNFSLWLQKVTFPSASVLRCVKRWLANVSMLTCSIKTVTI